MGTGRTNSSGPSERLLKVYRGTAVQSGNNDVTVNVGHPVRYVYVKLSTTTASATEATRFARVWDTADTNLSAKGFPSFVVYGDPARDNSSIGTDSSEETFLGRSANEKSFTIYLSSVPRRNLTCTWTALCLEE